MTRQLTAIIEREDNGYVALCPEVDVASQRFRFPSTDSELLADLTPETAHADELAKITVSEFGD